MPGWLALVFCGRREGMTLLACAGVSCRGCGEGKQRLWPPAKETRQRRLGLLPCVSLGLAWNNLDWLYGALDVISEVEVGVRGLFLRCSLGVNSTPVNYNSFLSQPPRPDYASSVFLYMLSGGEYVGEMFMESRDSGRSGMAERGSELVAGFNVQSSK